MKKHLKIALAALSVFSSFGTALQAVDCVPTLQVLALRAQASFARQQYHSASAIADRIVNEVRTMVPSSVGESVFFKQQLIVYLNNLFTTQYRGDQSLIIVNELFDPARGLSFSNEEVCNITNLVLDSILTSVQEVREILSVDLAANLNLPHLLTRLINAKFPINTAGTSGYTPLMSAVARGHENIVRMLLAHGAEVIPDDAERWEVGYVSPLVLAVQGNHRNIVQLLCQQESMVEDEKVVACINAIKLGHEGLVDFFLDNGVNVNSRDDYSLLMHASENENMSLIQNLIARGALVNFQSDEGETALMVAVSGGHTAAVLFLLKHNAHTDLVDEDGVTALHCAALGNCHIIISALIDANAPIDARDTFGQTSLMGAIEHGNADSVRVLLNANASTTIPDNNNAIPLVFALTVDDSPNKKEIIMMLVKHGADVNVIEQDTSFSALHLVVLFGDAQIVQAMIDKGVRYDEIVNTSFETPLIQAARANKPEIIKVLLAAGANPDHKNIASKTAFQVAQETRAFESAHVLANAYKYQPQTGHKREREEDANDSPSKRQRGNG